jgi:hypothetical protein
LAARAAAGVLAAALVLAGCSSKAKDDGDKAAAGGMKTGQGISGKTITLGVLTDMSGVYATLG